MTPRTELAELAELAETIANIERPRTFEACYADGMASRMTITWTKSSAEALAIVWDLCPNAAIVFDTTPEA